MRIHLSAGLAAFFASLALSPSAMADEADDHIRIIGFDTDTTGATIPEGPVLMSKASIHIFAYSDVKTNPGTKPADLACIRKWLPQTAPNVLVGATGTTGNTIDDKSQWNVTCDPTRRIVIAFRDIHQPQFVGFRIVAKRDPNATNDSKRWFKVSVYKSRRDITPDNLIYSVNVPVLRGNVQGWVSLADRGVNPDQGGDIAAFVVEPSAEVQNDPDPTLREFGIDNLHFDP